MANCVSTNTEDTSYLLKDYNKEVKKEKILLVAAPVILLIGTALLATIANHFGFTYWGLLARFGEVGCAVGALIAFNHALYNWPKEIDLETD